jgi:ATP-binding cassette subfamily B protein
MPVRWLRQHIATVSQEPVLFCCSIADNIRYARKSASDDDVKAAALLANAHDFIRWGMVFMCLCDV